MVLSALKGRAAILMCRGGFERRYLHVVRRDLSQLQCKDLQSFHSVRDLNRKLRAGEITPHDCLQRIFDPRDGRALQSISCLGEVMFVATLLKQDVSSSGAEESWVRFVSFLRLNVLDKFVSSERAALLRIVVDLPVFVGGELCLDICRIILLSASASDEEKAFATIVGLQIAHAVAARSSVPPQ